MFVPNIWLLMPTLTDSLHCQRFSLVVTRYNRILRVLFYVVWSYVYFTLASPLNIFTCATYSMSMTLNDDVIYAWHWLPGELPIPFRLSVLCWRFNLTFNKRHVFGVFCHKFEYLSRYFWRNVMTHAPLLAAMITNNSHVWFLSASSFRRRLTILPFFPVSVMFVPNIWLLMPTLTDSLHW